MKPKKNKRKRNDLPSRPLNYNQAKSLSQNQKKEECLESGENQIMADGAKTQPNFASGSKMQDVEGQTQGMAFSTLTKEQESLLNGNQNPVTAMKRFKATSGHMTGGLSSLATSVTYKKSFGTFTKLSKSNTSQSFSAMDSQSCTVTEMTEEKKKRGRPRGSYTSNRR